MNDTKLEEHQLRLSLFLLRVGVFIVFFMWSLNKLINPESAVAVFSHFYFFSGLSVELAYAIGFIQLLIAFSLLFGIKKQISYGLILFMHLGSTLLSYPKYFDPWSSPNLLFFAAWPMLAAIAALYILREKDTMFTITKSKAKP